MVPFPPLHRNGVGPARSGLHQNPATEDDEGADGMKAESRDFEPGQTEESEKARANSTPVFRRQLAMFKIGREEMEIDDRQD